MNKDSGELNKDEVVEKESTEEGDKGEADTIVSEEEEKFLEEEKDEEEDKGNTMKRIKKLT